jgi:hypothetical protein
MDELISTSADEGTLPSYGSPWTEAHRQRLQAIATRKAGEYAARGLTGHPRLWEPEKARLLLDLDRMLDDDGEWRAGRKAKVRSSELEFGSNGVAPVVIQLESGEVRMLGSADKIDETRDGVLLVSDLKSGSARKFASIEDDPVAAGTRLQLPAYAYAARQLLGGEKVEAMYWFVRKDAGKRIPVVLDEALEQKYARTIGTLVTSIATGLFPPKPPEKPAFGFVECEYCDPDGMGHGELRRSYERKRGDPVLRELIDLIDPEAVASTGSELDAGEDA